MSNSRIYIISFDNKGNILYFGGSRNGVDRFYQPTCIDGAISVYKNYNNAFKKCNELKLKGYNPTMINCCKETRYHGMPFEINYSENGYGVITPFHTLQAVINFIIGNELEEYCITHLGK
jgi:hypothetical protein